MQQDKKRPPPYLSGRSHSLKEGNPPCTQCHTRPRIHRRVKHSPYSANISGVGGNVFSGVGGSVLPTAVRVVRPITIAIVFIISFFFLFSLPGKSGCGILLFFLRKSTPKMRKFIFFDFFTRKMIEKSFPDSTRACASPNHPLICFSHVSQSLSANLDKLEFDD